ncbi:MAG TPA: hypothetical protein VGD45_20665 [Steroidobacter sp.]|uniref:hypothetical protein n=1 Tax=Steroidobacter sp. TaxID=1978227 RepID=UPI002EDA007D
MAASPPSHFALQIRAWAEKTGARMDDACRAIAIQVLTHVVRMSPVGNPELWAANAEAALQRSQHNQVVDQITANLMANPANLTAKGNLKRSVRSSYNKRLSKAQLAQTYPFRQGKYVGGRFRGNWQVSVSFPSSRPLDRIDPNGSQTIEAGAAALAGFEAGPSIYIMNNLPYALRLENGWSKQAPFGMVAVTVVEFERLAQQAIASVPE